MADFAKTIFTEHVMKFIAFKTLNAPAKAGGFYQLMENKKKSKMRARAEHVFGAQDAMGGLSEKYNWK